MTQWTYQNAENTVAYRTTGDGMYESRLVSAIELAEGETILPYVPDVQALASQMRDVRDLKLAECDWTQASDVPQATKDKWSAYRQALRDVPQQSGFPLDIVWPTKP
jgi:hypothetical protein